MTFCKPESAEERRCFLLEEPAPEFCAPAYYRGEQIEVCLNECRGKWAVVFFYSSDFTFV